MWILKKPMYGDQIRVNRGFYYHHGIYVTDDCVINFASNDPSGELNPKTARVIESTLKEFLKGGDLEVRSYTNEELKTKRVPQDIVNCAFSHLGEGGYDIINNNCEHFSNLCAFGVKKSNQVDKVLSFIFGGAK